MEAREQKIDRESVLRFRLALASFAGVLLLLRAQSSPEMSLLMLWLGACQQEL